MLFYKNLYSSLIIFQKNKIVLIFNDRILLLIFYPGFFKSARAKEFNLTLCNTREGHWRNNQHNYLFSGFLQDRVGKKGLNKGAVPHL